MAFPTIDELCKGKGLKGEELEGEQIKRILQNNKELRSVHRLSTNGWTKNRTMRRISDIPACLFLDPLSPFRPYWENDETDDFLKKYPEFLVVEKR